LQETDAIIFAATQLQIEFGDRNPKRGLLEYLLVLQPPQHSHNHTHTFNFRPKMFPRNLLNAPDADHESLVCKIQGLKDLLVGKSINDCKKVYLQMAQSLPYYGYSSFPVQVILSIFFLFVLLLLPQSSMLQGQRIKRLSSRCHPAYPCWWVAKMLYCFMAW